MLKKYIFFLILIFTSLLFGMEEKEKEKEKEIDTSLQDSSSPKISPRSSFNFECELLKLAPEILLLIIYYSIEDSADIDLELLNPKVELNNQNSWFNLLYENIPEQFRKKPKRQILPDILNLNKIYTKSILPLKLTCKAIKQLVPTARLQHCLNKLSRVSRADKIKLAHHSYENKHLNSFGLIITSICKEEKSEILSLDEGKTESLSDLNKIVLMFVSNNALSIDENKTFEFKLSENETDNLKLTSILIDLHSSEDQLITIDRIFQAIMINPNARNVLKCLINCLKNLDNLPKNDYITTRLMIDSFNGDLENFMSSIENSEEIYAETNRGFNAILWAIFGGDRDLLEFIFSRIPLDRLIKKNNANQNLCHFCALYATSETLEYVLKKLSSLKKEDLLSHINLLDNSQQTPLSYSIRTSSEPKVLLFIKFGAAIEPLKNLDLTPYNPSTSEMLNELISNKLLSPQIAQEFQKRLNTESELITPELIIKCCKKCKDAKGRKTTTMAVLFIGLLGAVAFGESD